MNIQERYQSLIDGIARGDRGLIRFSMDEASDLRDQLRKAREERNVAELEKILCLIEHSSMPWQGFEEELFPMLKSGFPDNLIVFALSAARKHVLQARFNKGHRLEYEFLESLKTLLHHRNPEVVEWTLRTIEECGNQGVYFLREFDKIKPAPWKWFNAHHRAVRELIELLERRWRRFEKSEPQKP